MRPRDVYASRGRSGASEYVCVMTSMYLSGRVDGNKLKEQHDDS